jgi:hypothetical protein
MMDAEFEEDDEESGMRIWTRRWMSLNMYMASKK